MGQYDASYLIRAGIRGKPGAVEASNEQDGRLPTTEEINATIADALEAKFRAWSFVVTSERLDK